MRGRKRHRKKAARNARRRRAEIMAGYFDAGAIVLSEGAKIATFQTRHHEGGDILRELLEYQSPPEGWPTPWIPDTEFRRFHAWATGR